MPSGLRLGSLSPLSPDLLLWTLSGTWRRWASAAPAPLCSLGLATSSLMGGRCIGSGIVERAEGNPVKGQNSFKSPLVV
ncbi:hypothetical protein EXIGLDRAFT_503703 [Exidia glandulosa HHB12029]|uniref:Uncharacterized protein n=1 Tax=Exidia glandulosa HHB12029 TaxID=1314781 RepID=A0A165JD62_EXIGL|nr:hypothetical protein EXIGLDRAFT_503703 [Exidia glandulosa HHB12029]